jgi:hypothetical protein
MSEPTRYRVANNQAQLTLGGGILAVDPAGPLVDYADYARLKAEVERLTKAGDAMHSFVIGYIVENRLSSSYLSKLDDGWQNAKGVQS